MLSRDGEHGGCESVMCKSLVKGKSAAELIEFDRVSMADLFKLKISPFRRVRVMYPECWHIMLEGHCMGD